MPLRGKAGSAQRQAVYALGLLCIIHCSSGADQINFAVLIILLVSMRVTMSKVLKTVGHLYTGMLAQAEQRIRCSCILL